MGNQAENAFKAAGIQAGENLGEAVNDALDTIEDALNDSNESVTIPEDSNTEGSDPEKPTVTIEQMQEKLNEQNKTIDRLVNIMGTMVTKLGAQQSDNTGENVNTTAFPQLGGNESENENIPLLENIKLG